MQDESNLKLKFSGLVINGMFYQSQRIIQISTAVIALMCSYGFIFEHTLAAVVTITTSSR